MTGMWLRAAMVSCAWMVASCGGGGGDDGPKASVSSDRTSVEFNGFAGGSTVSQSVALNLLSGEGTFYGDVVLDRPSEFGATFTPTGNTSATVTVTRLSSALPGSGSGSFVLRLCNDPACARIAWSQTITYRYASFAISRAALGFSGFQGGGPATQDVAITPADTDKRLVVSSTTMSGSGWLTASGSPSAVSVSATPGPRAAGIYQGAVQVRFAAAGNGATLQIPVGLTVGSGLTATMAAPLELSAETAKASGAVELAFNGQARSWTASTDQPWLVLDTPAGEGPGALQYHADVTRLGAVPNWGAASANITVRAAGLSDVVLPVSLMKRLPEVYVTSPATIPAGRPATVRIFGRGFSQLDGAGRIQVGGVTGVTGTVISDREAVLQVPALPVGRATVAVSNQAGAPTVAGTLGAVAASPPAGGFAPNDGEKRSILFDATRRAVYATNRTHNTLVRFRWMEDHWQADGVPVASIGDFAMAPDRKTLYVSSGAATVLAIDPDTLVVSKTHTLSSQSSGTLAPSRYSTRGMATTNDMRMWFGGSQWANMGFFDMLRGTFGAQSLGSNDFRLYSPEYYAPADGSKLFVLNPPLLSPRLPSHLYTSASASLSSPANFPNPYRDVSYDETGSKALVDDDTLYDGNTHQLLGTAKVTGVNATTSVLSPDGTRLYRLVSASSSSFVIDHVNVYDTTRLDAGTSAFIKVGEIPVTTQALDCGPQPAYACDLRGALVISPLGDTLFWAGNKGLVVIPIPGTLSGKALAAPRILRAAGG